MQSPCCCACINIVTEIYVLSVITVAMHAQACMYILLYHLHANFDSSNRKLYIDVSTNLQHRALELSETHIRYLKQFSLRI